MRRILPTPPRWFIRNSKIKEKNKLLKLKQDSINTNNQQIIIDPKDIITSTDNPLTTQADIHQPPPRKPTRLTNTNHIPDQQQTYTNISQPIITAELTPTTSFTQLLHDSLPILHTSISPTDNNQRTHTQTNELANQRPPLVRSVTTL